MNRIPRFLDEEPSILGMSPDEFAIFGFVFIFSYLMDKLLAGIILSLIVLVALKKWKAGKPSGYIIHRLYLLGVPLRGFLPPPSVNNFYYAF